MHRSAIMLAIALCATPAMAQHQHQHQHQHRHHGSAAGPAPTEAGQDAFAAVAEIVRMLRADPRTDWSKVNLDRLREHLLDMHEVVLRADVVVTSVAGGFTASVTGQGRTGDAIKRMVPTHAAMMNGTDGWRVTTEGMAGGVRLTVVADDPAQTLIIRGLGFIGIMASGDHHQPHHLEMARGTFAH